MALKRPKDIPKLHKTRKKKAESILEAIPQEKPDKPEFTCGLSYKYEERENKQYTVITIQTVAEFTVFNYSIDVEVYKDKNQINIFILGLNTSTSMIRNVQPARVDIPIEELNGEILVQVIKQDGAINFGEYYLNIYKKEIKLLNSGKTEKQNNRIFCDFYVDEKEFSFIED